MLSLSDPISFRKAVAGVSLIGFSLAGLISCLPDANEGTGTKGAQLQAIAAAHHSGIWLSGLIFMLSAILTVPALGGMLHLLRHRGVAAGHIGAVFLLLGAFGHMGYGTWQLMVSRVPGGTDPAAMAAYLDRASVIQGVLLPLLFAVVIGLVLMTIALRRSGFAPLWVPVAAVAVTLFELGSNATALSNSKWTPVVTWAIVAITFGYLGIRVLAMSRDAWAQQLAAGPARLVRAGSAAGRPVPAPAAGTVTESA